MTQETQPEGQSTGAVSDATGELDEILSQPWQEIDKDLRARLKPEKTAEITRAVDIMVAEALDNEALRTEDFYSTIGALIGEIDKRISAQVNEIIHDDKFQKLESAWRGLYYFVTSVPLGQDVQVCFLNVSKTELTKMFRKFPNKAWMQSPLYTSIYSKRLDQLGGEPFGALICDFAFDHSTADVEVMEGLVKLAAVAHAPVIANASPKLFGFDEWPDIDSARGDVSQVLADADHARWRELRESEDSRYLALTMPRFLGREPYGDKNPIEAFNFQEVTDGKHSKYLWCGAAYALATRITDAFKSYGWCTRIWGVESGGKITGLPVTTFETDDGGNDMKCPTEISIWGQRETVFSNAGLLPLCHQAKSSVAVFMGCQTVNKPKKYVANEKGDIATASADMSAKLSYMFASSRFAHYLKGIVRNWCGKDLTGAQIQSKLHEWVTQYVDGNPDNSSDKFKAEHPLREAEVKIIPDPRSPGKYQGIFKFVPGFQFTGAELSVSMTSRLDTKS